VCAATHWGGIGAKCPERRVKTGGDFFRNTGGGGRVLDGNTIKDIGDRRLKLSWGVRSTGKEKTGLTRGCYRLGRGLTCPVLNQKAVEGWINHSNICVIDGPRREESMVDMWKGEHPKKPSTFDYGRGHKIIGHAG